MKVHLWPHFRGEDKGDGGVRRVVEAQTRYLPEFGIDIVDAPDADVIACHISVPPPYKKLYPKTPIIAHIHGLYWSEYEWERWSLEANAKVIDLIRSSQAVTAPSEWVANAIRRNTSREVTVIPHGVDLDEWTPDPEPLDYVLWNKTRPDPVCDPEPINQLANILQDVRFISTFGEARENLDITGRLSYEDGKILVKRAGVYLCTTRETFGIGTLEAMAAGVPVVGWDWGGQREFIKHGVDGWLCEPGDVFSLITGIRWALANRYEIAEAAREKARQYDWRSINKAYADLCQKAVDRSGRGPRTSIIITNYNLHEYLDDALRSVAQQSDRDWECIVVDDASTDPRGREIAKEWRSKDKRFRVIENEQNQYLAGARNTGINVANGRYILPLDADDMIAPNTVALLADALDKNPSIHVAYGNVLFVEEDGKTLSIYNNPDNPGHSGWPMRFTFEQQVQQRNLLPYSSMFRRSAWRQAGGYRTRCRTAEDADFWVRLSSYGFTPEMVTSEDTLIYRNREGSMSRTQSPTDWMAWFPWHGDKAVCPAGAPTREQLPVDSYDPIMISVVIPVGPKHETLVSTALDSIEAQTFRHYEVIVVNDTGRPLPVLPAWARLVETEGRIGAAAARNLGIRVARAPLFLPLDADDYLQPAALQQMYDAYKQTGDVIYTDFYEDPEKEGDLTVWHTPDYDAHLLTRVGCIHAVTALTPWAYWDRVGGYDESLSAWEDWDFQLKLADAGLCSRRLASPLLVYRKHTGFRRDSNYEQFEASKQAILSKWSDLWDGGKELAGCSSCGGRRTIPAASTVNMRATREQAPSDDAILIQYLGKKQGSIPFKGSTGTTYWFAANEPPKYVLKKDADVLLRYSDFQIATTAPSLEPDALLRVD